MITYNTGMEIYESTMIFTYINCKMYIIMLE